MFDSLGAFSRQFTPVDGGYLYYPSRKDGGKLVTAEEFETLVSDWQRVAGRSGTWKSGGLIGLAILIWILVSQALALPTWTDWIIIIAAVAGLSGWILWNSFAPRRLVRDRPEVAPPRPSSQVRREARAALKWPVVILVVLLSGAIFIGHWSSPDDSLTWWAWTLGSGLMVGTYTWIAVQKLRDS